MKAIQHVRERLNEVPGLWQDALRQCDANRNRNALKKSGRWISVLMRTERGKSIAGSCLLISPPTVLDNYQSD